MKIYFALAALAIGFGISLLASAEETCQNRLRQVGFATYKSAGHSCKTTYWFNR